MTKTNESNIDVLPLLAPLVLSAKIETKCTPEMTRADLDAALESTALSILESLFGDTAAIVQAPFKTTASGCGPGWFCMESTVTLMNGAKFELYIHQQRLVRD